MSRIRSVHPGFYTDEDIVTVSMAARLCLIGLGIEADDKGIFEWKPVRLKMRLFPVDAIDMPEILEELAEAGLVRAFEVDGRRYGAIRNFRKHQKPKTPNDIHPAPDEILDYVALAAPISEKPPRKQPQFPQKGEKSFQMEDGGGKREEESLDADASNGAAPADPPKDDPPSPEPIDLAASLFDGGVRMLARTGLSNDRARRMIGKLRQSFSDGVILSVLAKAQGLNPPPSDLFSWLTAAAKHEKGKINDAPAPNGADAGPGPTERAAMAAFGINEVVGAPPDPGAAGKAADRDPDRRAISRSGDAD